MKVTFNSDGGFEINFTEAELSAQYTVPESAYAEICSVAKERMKYTLGHNNMFPPLQMMPMMYGFPYGNPNSKPKPPKS